MHELPIDAVLPELLAALREGPRALLVAPPGAGKTTRVAPALLAEPWCGGQVLLLVPRRLAARAAAEFMARELGEATGATIGYATRLDSKVGKATPGDRHDPRRVPRAAPGRSRTGGVSRRAVRRGPRAQPRQRPRAGARARRRRGAAPRPAHPRHVGDARRRPLRAAARRPAADRKRGQELSR